MAIIPEAVDSPAGESSEHGLRELTLQQFHRLRRAGAVKQIGLPFVVHDFNSRPIDEVLDGYDIPKLANAYIVGEGRYTYHHPTHFRKMVATPVVFYRVE